MATNPSSDLVCDACGSDQLRKYSVVYEEQRSSYGSESKLAGIGFGSQGLGVGMGRGKTTGTSSSELARRLAPPNKEAMTGNDPITALVTAAALLAGASAAYVVYRAAGVLWALGTFVVVFMVGAMVGANLSTVDERYRKIYAEWDRKYICMKCGATKIQTVEERRGSAVRAADDPELDRLIREGRTIEAVKRLRDNTGISLSDAVDRVKHRSDLLS